MKWFIGFLLCCVSLNATSANLKSVSLNLQKGERARTIGLFEKAISECKEGIVSLKGEYFSEDVIDDTGLKIALAEAKYREKDLKTTAILYCRMLETRIEMYKRKLEKLKSRHSDNVLTGQSTEHRQ